MDLKTAKNVFSNLMVKAQEKPLTALQKRTLLRARQTIRKHAKPAMNAKHESEYRIEKEDNGLYSVYTGTILIASGFPTRERARQYIKDNLDFRFNPKRLEVPRRKHGVMSGSKYSRFFTSKAKARAHLKKLNAKGVYGVISRIPDRYGLFELSVRKPNPSQKLRILRIEESMNRENDAVVIEITDDQNIKTQLRIKRSEFPDMRFPSAEDILKKAKEHMRRFGPFNKRKNTGGGVKIYGRCLRIEAVKMVNHTYGGKPTKAGQHYFHDFTTKNAIIYGMPDGSLRIVAK